MGVRGFYLQREECVDGGEGYTYKESGVDGGQGFYTHRGVCGWG